MMKKLVKAGLTALSLSGTFGGVASAQDGWEGRPFYFNSIVGLLATNGLTPDRVQWDQLYPRDTIGVLDCYDHNNDGLADQHAGGQNMNGGDYRYTFMIVTGDEDHHVTPHYNVTMAEAVEALSSVPREPLTVMGMGVLFNHEQEIVRMYYATSQEGDATLSVDRVARPFSTNQIGPSSNPPVACNTLSGQPLRPKE